MKTEDIRRIKKSMRTSHLIALVISWSLVCFSTPALSQYKVACTCLPPPSPSDEFGVSRSVFSGRVTSIQVDTSQANMLKVTFQVIHGWKGIDASQVSIYTAPGGASCGFTFHVDSTYLVYTYQYFDALATNLCMRTTLLSRAAEDLAFLTTVFVEKYPGGVSIPLALELSQNYPNPFNPSTTISFSLSKATNVSLGIFNTLGQAIAVLVNERKEAGSYKSMWNSSDVPSGIYFYRLQAGEYVETKKMVLIK